LWQTGGNNLDENVGAPTFSRSERNIIVAYIVSSSRFTSPGRRCFRACTGTSTLIASPADELHVSCMNFKSMTLFPVLICPLFYTQPSFNIDGAPLG
jgi:hypothetical protein